MRDEIANEIEFDNIPGRLKSYVSGLIRAFVVGLLVLMQFAIIIFMPFLLRNFTVYFYFVLEVFSIVVILGLVNANKSPSYKIAWISIVLILPISGHIMYLLWGKPDSKRKLDRKVIQFIDNGTNYLSIDQDMEDAYEIQNPQNARISAYMRSQDFPLFKNNELTYYRMGEEAFHEIIASIEKAERFILVNFFIVAEGALWDSLHNVLLKKIQEGVEVKFMFDDFGAMFRTDSDFADQLRKEGFEVRIFNPVHKYASKLYMNYRDHQKIVVIDGNVGFTGGFNIADEYVNKINRFGRWKDTGIQIAGEGVWGLTVVFLQMWDVCSEKFEAEYDKYRPTLTSVCNDNYVRVISDGPSNNPNNPIESIYLQMIEHANDKLYISTPYLILENEMKDALIRAVKSGVDVRIITPYIPDKKMVKRLTNYNYEDLLKAGVRIFEYEPGFNHAKMIMNESSCIVGTINMDYRSFYLHYENGVWVHAEAFLRDMEKDFIQMFEESREYTWEDWRNRPTSWKMTQPVLNLFSTLL
ncbi:MAG: cardiolipin synthase [Lachnospiraceae bacterium]|nr:cardiolipin synthase [Lachnospiraceae bacterium]